MIYVLCIETREQIGNGNMLWTSVGAIAASCALNEVHRAEHTADLFDRLALCGVERFEILHIGQVVRHLLHIAHARKHHKDAVKARGKAYRIACGASAVQIVKYLLRLVGELYKISALYGFHNYHGLAVLAADLIAAARLDRGVAKINVVELYLNEFDLRIFGKYRVEQSTSAVSWKEMPK